MKVTQDASGNAVVTDWLGITPSDVEEDIGGPLPSKECLRIDVDETRPHEIISARIPLQPDTDYIFSGWFNLTGTLSYRCFDALGNPVAGNQLYTDNQNNWQWRSWIFKRNAMSRGIGELIDPKTATIEIVFRPNHDFLMAGVSLKVRRVPVDPSKPSSPAAK